MRKLFIVQFACVLIVLIIGYQEIRVGKKLINKRIINDTSIKKRALLVYVYIEKNDVYRKSLSYFVEIGVQESDSIDYLFIIQGWNVSVPLPIHYKNVQVLKRPNTCFDFGAYGIGLKYMGGLKEVGDKYEYFILMNPSGFGPFLPKYWPENIHWTEILLSQLKGTIHATSATVSCSIPGPYLDGWLIAATHQAILTGNRSGTFVCHQNKHNAVHRGEIAFTQSIIAAGLNVDCLLLKYPSGFNWTNKANNNCDRRPMWNKGYTSDRGNAHMTAHPLETVFYKPIWFDEYKKLVSSVYFDECLAYMEWAVKRKKFKV